MGVAHCETMPGQHPVRTMRGVTHEESHRQVTFERSAESIYWTLAQKSW